MEEKGIKLETHFFDRRRKVWADPHQMSQVIQNLLQNIWQYAPSGGTALISTESTPDSTRVVFTNTGGEIAAEDLPFIFDPFHRGKHARKYDGYGVGLAAVKTIV